MSTKSALLHQVFSETDLTRTAPGGWLRRYLETQAEGLTGHLEEAGYPFDAPNCAWLPGPEGENDWNWVEYEQRAYWLDGMIRCGLLLDHKPLIDKAAARFEHVLGHQRESGYLGPDILLDATRYPRFGRWSHTVFFRGLMAYAGVVGDDRIAAALENHYLSGTATHEQGRDVCNAEVMIWTYTRTGNAALLRMANEAWREYQPLQSPPHHHTTERQMLVDEAPEGHGVSYNEIAKIPAVLSMATGSDEQLAAARSAYEKLERYCMLVDGVHSSSEFLRGRAVLDSHETCDIADYTWSLGYLLMATGEAAYADRIERAIFNAAPGAVREDFRGLQYFSCPNQVIADRRSNHNEFQHGSQWMSYRPNPGTECCPGDVNRIMPNFAGRIWMTDQSGHPVVAFYAPAGHTYTIDGQAVRLNQETTYPFEETIRIAIDCEHPARFALTLRIPGWTVNPRLEVNGTDAGIELPSGQFIRLEREWRPGDRVELTLPMKWRTSRWENGIALERGPLVYSLRIEEDWQVDPDEPRSSHDFPAWNLYAASPWNYALILDEDNPAASVELVENPTGDPERPWSIDRAPHTVRVKARRVEGWKLLERDHILKTAYKNGKAIADETTSERIEGDYRFTPPLPAPETIAASLDNAVETVTLVPYGCTHLRVTIFPFIGPDA